MDIQATFRHLRCRFRYWQTIHTHHDERDAVLRYPWGFGWVRYDGIDYCPLCGSISCHSLMQVTEGVKRSNIAAAIKEMERLVGTGEMDPSPANYIKARSPVEGEAIGHYHFDQYGVPDTIVIMLSDASFALSCKHLLDVTPLMRPVVADRINRLCPQIHLGIDDDGDFSWSPVGIAQIISQPAEEPEGEPGTEDPPSPEGDHPS